MLTIEKQGKKKRVTELAWELMGESKNGWSLVVEPSQSVKNEVVAPPTGETKNLPSNKSVKNEVETAKVQNVVVDEVKTSPKTEETAPVLNDQVQSGTSVPEKENPADVADKTAFVEFAKASLKREEIKNYLDANKIKYKQNSTDLILHELLADHFMNNIDLAKADFNIVDL